MQLPERDQLSRRAIAQDCQVEFSPRGQLLLEFGEQVAEGANLHLTVQ